MQALFEKIQPQGQSFQVKERCDPQFEFRWHYHPEIELTLIQESHGTRFVGDDLSRYGPGDLVLLGPNLPHTWQSDEQSRLKKHRALYTQFHSDFLGDTFFATPELSGVRRLLENAGRGLRFSGRTVPAANALLEKMLASSGVKRVTLLLELLDLLSNARSATPLSSRAFAPALNHADQNRIDTVCRFINERYTEGVAQPEVARIAHLSVPAFSRFFKRSLGRTFTAYVNELRIGRACQMLIESDKSVAEICYASGFENLSNFNRRFLTLKKTGPREFRRRYQHAGTA